MRKRIIFSIIILSSITLLTMLSMSILDKSGFKEFVERKTIEVIKKELIEENKVDYSFLKVGKCYLHSFNWNEENPFKKTKVDTIKLLSIDSTKRFVYVEYVNTYNIRTTYDIKSFVRNLKELDQHK